MCMGPSPRRDYFGARGPLDEAPSPLSLRPAEISLCCVKYLALSAGCARGIFWPAVSFRANAASRFGHLDRLRDRDRRWRFGLMPCRTSLGDIGKIELSN